MTTANAPVASPEHHKTHRSIKKGVFLVLRQTLYTVQATVFVGGNVGRPMVQYAEDISKESVVDVRGTVVVTPSPVSGCTQKEVELKIEEVSRGRGCGCGCVLAWQSSDQPGFYGVQ